MLQRRSIGSSTYISLGCWYTQGPLSTGAEVPHEDVHLYMNKKIRVRWDDAMSQEYTISNGVKQGGVMSPVLFKVYLDELLLKGGHHLPKIEKNVDS